VIYPPAAGVLSAAGFLAAPPAFDFAAPEGGLLSAVDWSAVRERLAALAKRGRAVLARAGGAVARTRIRADMQWAGQGSELTVEAPDDLLDGADPAAALLAAFEAAYRATYGQTPPGAAAEVLTWRVIVEGPNPALSLSAEAAPGEALKGRRALWVGEGFAEVPVYDRYRLAPGAAFDGPAIIEERESTVVIDGPAAVTVHDSGALIAAPGEG
jgi:N-methylhydantoinase A